MIVSILKDKRNPATLIKRWRRVKCLQQGLSSLPACLLPIPCMSPWPPLHSLSQPWNVNLVTLVCVCVHAFLSTVYACLCWMTYWLTVCQVGLPTCCSCSPSDSACVCVRVSEWETERQREREGERERERECVCVTITESIWQAYRQNSPVWSGTTTWHSQTGRRPSQVWLEWHSGMMSFCPVVLWQQGLTAGRSALKSHMCTSHS